MKIRLNQNLSTPFGKFKKDEIINIEIDADGVATQKFWRNRIADSVIDNCVTIVAEEKSLDINTTNVEAASGGEVVSNSKNKKNK